MNDIQAAARDLRAARYAATPHLSTRLKRLMTPEAWVRHEESERARAAQQAARLEWAKHQARVVVGRNRNQLQPRQQSAYTG